MNYFDHNARQTRKVQVRPVDRLTEKELAKEIRAAIDANDSGIYVQESFDEIALERVKRQVRT